MGQDAVPGCRRPGCLSGAGCPVMLQGEARPEPPPALGSLVQDLGKAVCDVMMEKKSQLGAGTVLEMGSFSNICFSSLDKNPSVRSWTRASSS